MKKNVLLIVSLISLLSNAQSPIFQWAKGMGGPLQDEGYSIAVDTFGNVYTTGYFSDTADFDPGLGIFNLTSVGFDDIFISKLDPSGNFLWAKQMGGNYYNDDGRSIAIDAAGNVYTSGYFNETVDFDPGVGNYNLTSSGLDDIFISKLDASGNFLWAKHMGSASYDEGWSIEIDASGNVYTTGFFSGTVDFDPGVGNFNISSSGSNDLFISKLDASGNFLWAKNIGGTSYVQGNSIEVDAMGNVYTTGYFFGTVDFNPGVGTFNLTSNGNEDVFISKLNSSGDFLWAKKIGGSSGDYGQAIALDASGNIYTTGFFAYTVDFDPGPGTFNLSSTGGFQDIFISKLDASGNFLWAKQMPGTGNSASYSIKLDATGNVYTTGVFQYTIDFDPNAGIANLTSSGGVNTDIFISKLDALGNFLWAIKLGDTLYDQGSSIAIDQLGNVYTTGYFIGTSDFDPGVGTFNLTSTGDYSDIFIQKLSQPTIGINENTTSNNIVIYPNPNNGLFKFEISTPIKNTKIQVYNSLGACVYQTSSDRQSTIDLTNQANGLYFVKVMSENKIIATQKIVKE